MLVKEFRIIMPLSLAEEKKTKSPPKEGRQLLNIIRIWQNKNGVTYSVARASLEETGGGEGIEILVNKPFKDTPLRNGRYSKGQYTKKIHRIESKVNWFMRKLAPKEWLVAIEESWNAFPYIKTYLTNDGIGPGNAITIESMHLADRGTGENALELPKEILDQREVIMIDIASEVLHQDDYKESTDPTKFKSKKSQRGPLCAEWFNTCDPVMCAYKVITVEFNRWPLLRSRVENYFAKQYKRTFHRYHRQIFCWMDEWHGLSIQQLRTYEDEMRKRLAEEIKSGTKRGVVGETD